MGTAGRPGEVPGGRPVKKLCALQPGDTAALHALYRMNGQSWCPSMVMLLVAVTQPCSHVGPLFWKAGAN